MLLMMPRLPCKMTKLREKLCGWGSSLFRSLRMLNVICIKPSVKLRKTFGNVNNILCTRCTPWILILYHGPDYIHTKCGETGESIEVGEYTCSLNGFARSLSLCVSWHTICVYIVYIMENLTFVSNVNSAWISLFPIDKHHHHHHHQAKYYLKKFYFTSIFLSFLLVSVLCNLLCTSSEHNVWGIPWLLVELRHFSLCHL